jgi:hypothetical protein
MAQSDRLECDRSRKRCQSPKPEQAAHFGYVWDGAVIPNGDIGADADAKPGMPEHSRYVRGVGLKGSAAGPFGGGEVSLVEGRPCQGEQVSCWGHHQRRFIQGNSPADKKNRQLPGNSTKTV